MRLQAYIKQIGAREFAQRFGVSERAALSWQYGARKPRGTVARKIVAGSPVTWDGIYGDEPREKRARSSHASQ